MFFRFCLMIGLMLPAAAFAGSGHEGHPMPASAMAAMHHADTDSHAATAAAYSAIGGEETLKKGEVYNGKFVLKNAAGKPVSPDDLQEVHTRKVHAMVIDQTLGDYHHLHPEYTGKDGIYTFSFTPGSSREYKVWVDITPKGEKQNLVTFTLNGADRCADGCVEKTLNDRGEFAANKAVVTFDRKLKAGEMATGTVTLTDAKGAPLSKLEPVMGAYAHIAGFYDDFKTMQHIHPMGAEPAKDADRGTSPLTFMLTPAKKGFLKYFVQLRVDGQDVFLPMGVDIE